MDWLKGMNAVVEHIEENLTQPIRYETLSRLVGCSVYEFSRIFSFMAGVSLSEYIRRRRLSQAAFDIQNGSEKVIDIALKYCYESPTTFTRAFKELHGITPSEARQSGVILKTYPPISFQLTIRGVNEMKHRIEKKDAMTLYAFQIGAASGVHQAEQDYPVFYSLKWISDIMNFEEEKAKYSPGLFDEIKENAKSWGYGDDWEKWRAEKVGNVVVIDQGTVKVGPHNHTDGSPVDPMFEDGSLRTFTGKIGDENDLQIIPAATWAVFAFDTEISQQNLSEAYTRILTEFLPISGYNRDMTTPHMEQYHVENDTWEIWLPVVGR